MVRTRAGWASVGAMTSSRKEGLLFECGKFSGGQFLVDPKAEVSVFPASTIVSYLKHTVWCFASCCKWYNNQNFCDVYHLIAFHIETVQVGLHHHWGAPPPFGCPFPVGQFPPSGPDGEVLCGCWNIHFIFTMLHNGLGNPPQHHLLAQKWSSPVAHKLSQNQNT